MIGKIDYALHSWLGQSICLVLITIVLTGCGGSETDQAGGNSPADSVVVTLVATESVSVLELTKQSHQVDFEPSVMGAFVKGIDSVASDNGWYWVYSVNSSMAETSCDNYFCELGDTVRWHFRKAGK